MATYPHIDQRSLLGPDPPADPTARLEIVAADHTRRILTYEPEMRAAKVALADDDELSAPTSARTAACGSAGSRMPSRRCGGAWRRTGCAGWCSIGATLGVEAFVWLTDIAGLTGEEATAIMRSNASGLLRSALLE